MNHQPLPSPLVHPLDDNQRLVDLIAETLDRPQKWVRQLLEQEERLLGTHHRDDFRESGVEPFVWSDALADYYRNTDSGLTGQPAWNRRPEKLRIRQWMGQHLARENSESLEILTVGDGAGFDSLYLSQCGHRVTYSEESRVNVDFAKKLFALNQANINVVDDPTNLPSCRFDVVVCLDVLEHVEDPPALVRKIAEWLSPGGRLIVHAPFFFVSHLNPTHLESNICYSGSLSRLYGRQGLHLIDGRFLWDPIVLQKPLAGGCAQRRLLWPLVLRCSGLLLAVARVWRWPHEWIASRLMQRRHDKWLTGLQTDNNSS